MQMTDNQKEARKKKEEKKDNSQLVLRAIKKKIKTLKINH